MKEVKLAKLAGEKGYEVVADALGCSASAVSQAIARECDVRVKVYADGKMTAYQVKPFPSRGKPRRNKDAAPETDDGVSRQEPH